MRQRFSGMIALWAALWAGFLMGVSGLATLAKFHAGSITLPVALDVGRVTFAALEKAEFVFLGVLVLLVIAAGLTLPRLGLIIVLALGRLAQSIWLLPVLSGRVEAILKGLPWMPGVEHRWYVAIEGGKILVLLLFAMGAIWTMFSDKSPRPSE